jgi:hypothetical protein
VTATSDAWAVVQIAELARTSEELLLRTLDTLDVDVRAAMPEDAAWTLSGADAEELRALLIEHGEIAERLQVLAEQLPEHGVTGTYDDVRDGAAAALADGILDPATVAMTATALDARTGWIALADALVSTDTQSAWTQLSSHELLSSFRRADTRLVARVLEDAAVEPDACWPDLTADTTRRLATTLRTYAKQS